MITVSPFQQESIKISISDTGIGMSPEQLAKVEEILRTKQGQKVTKNSTGLGLGFIMAATVVERLGSEGNNPIQVKSELEIGTTVDFLISNKQFEPSEASFMDVDELSSEEGTGLILIRNFVQVDTYN